jgi:hypothetical protein
VKSCSSYHESYRFAAILVEI